MLCAEINNKRRTTSPMSKCTTMSGENIRVDNKNIGKRVTCQAIDDLETCVRFKFPSSVRCRGTKTADRVPLRRSNCKQTLLNSPEKSSMSRGRRRGEAAEITSERFALQLSQIMNTVSAAFEIAFVSQATVLGFSYRVSSSARLFRSR